MSLVAHCINTLLTLTRRQFIQCLFYTNHWEKSINMRDLAAVLSRLNYHQARRIARTLGAPQPAADRIEHWRAAVASHWSDPDRAAQTIAQLSAPAHAALKRLVALDAAPLRLVVGEYGALRLQRPRREPPTVTEQLYERGLLHSADDQPWSRVARLMIPADLRARLQPLLAPAIEAPVAANIASLDSQASDAPPALLHDLSQLLIFCLGPNVLQGPARRWLKPRALRSFNQRLLQPLTLSPHATHKQTPYLRMLSLLAGAAKLIEHGAPTAAAWRWLEEKPSIQLRILLHAWRDAEPGLREQYAVAYEPPTPPAPWLPTLLHYIAQQRSLWTPQMLTEKILGHESALNAFFAAHFASLTAVDEVIAHLCAGPLTWLGIVEHFNAQHQVAAPDANDRSTAAQRPYRTTLSGRWLIAPDESDDPPAWRWRSDGAQRQDEEEGPGWWLWLPWDAQPALVARVACFAEQRSLQRTPTLRHGFCFTPQTVAVAAANGQGLPALLGALDALKLTLSSAQQTELLYWRQAGGWPLLEVMPVLRTANRTQLAQLYANPQVASLLGDPLNSTTATWRGEMGALVKRLRTAGFAPVVGMTAPAAAAQDMDGHAGALWLAAQLYAALGRHLALPFALPSALVDTLYRQLDLAQQAWLHVQLEQLVQQLSELLDGLTPLPSPYPSNPAEWRPLLDETIVAEGVVELLYWSAGRSLLTYRRVRPLWFSERGGVDYLRAECLASGRYLHFRLDRIVAIVRVSGLE